MPKFRVELLDEVEFTHGSNYDVGTPVTVDGESPESILENAELQGYVYVTFPDGECRQLEPDYVDLVSLLWD